MSFSSHKRKAMDSTLPVNERLSHLRSCAVHMHWKYKVPRSVIMERVAELCGVNIERKEASETEIQAAVQAMLLIKESGLDAPDSGHPGAPSA